MVLPFNRFKLFQLLNSFQHKFAVLGNRQFNFSQVLNKEKLTVELLPEVENALESGEVKHRKHPGIQKIQPISVPEILKVSVDNILSGESETLLCEKAVDVCNHLMWRKQPIEKEEIDKRIQARLPQFEGAYGEEYEELSAILTKQQLKQLRKSINLAAGRWKPMEYDRYISLAYLVGRLAPNFASVSYVFNELIKNDPEFKPENYFDFGSGVGSALWGAHAKWSETIKEYFCIDTSSHMNDISLSLITNETTEEKHINHVYFRQFLPASDTTKYDLVVSAFSLLELPGIAERLKVIDTLWRKTKQYLIVIEHGTIAGFSCVLDARDFISKVENDDSPEFAFYSSGAHVISPCPHELPCPKFMEKRSSCGFSVPYYPLFPRHRQQIIHKDWISYVIIKKGPRPENSPALPRIVKPVLKKHKHVVCRLCCNDGKLKEVVVTKAKHGRHAYRCVRESNQGDQFPGNIKLKEMPDDPF